MRSDLDNIKFVLDALNKIVYDDDSLIVEIQALKEYDDVERTEIDIIEVQ